MKDACLVEEFMGKVNGKVHPVEACQFLFVFLSSFYESPHCLECEIFSEIAQ